MFGGGSGAEKAENAWTNDGVRSWHKFKSCGTKNQSEHAEHFSSSSHKSALLSYAHFAKTSGHVDAILDKTKRSALIQEEEDLQQNRRIIEILLDRFNSASSKTLKMLACSQLWQIHATPDVYHKDRLAVACRYVDNDKGQPRERLMSLTEAKDKTGEGGANEIIESLTKNGLDLNVLCFQSYDYTASMSGRFNGVQRKLQDKLGRNVPYIPCLAHRSNTVIEHSCKASPIIAELFNII